jgi:hypothetical protein
MRSTGAHSPDESVVRTVIIDRLCAEVVEGFRGAGVRSILLKGPSIARWLYESPSSRPYGDCDLLVSPQSLATAQMVLLSLGYVPVSGGLVGDRPRPAEQWNRWTMGASVDLHQNLRGIQASARETWDVLAGQTDRMRVGGSQIEVLSIPARAMHVALHAAQHGSMEEKPLEDLRRALSLVPSDAWREAAAMAIRLDAVPAFRTGLGLLPEGRDLGERLGLPARTTVEVALRVASAHPAALGIDWLAQTPGARAKVALVARRVFPPAAYMRAWRPLASRGRVGLVLTYLWRPLWLLRHAPAGFATWRRAKKGSG